MITCDWGQNLAALYWFSPVATSFQQDELWWGDEKVLTLSHFHGFSVSHAAEARFTRQPMSVADERLVSIVKINSGLLSLQTSAIYYCGQGTQESAFCFLWESCSALQCCDCHRHVFLWLVSFSCFLTFLFCLKVYASQVKQWSVSIGATWSCNGSSGQQSHRLWWMLTRHRGGSWGQLLPKNCSNLGLSLEEEG